MQQKRFHGKLIAVLSAYAAVTQNKLYSIYRFRGYHRKLDYKKIRDIDSEGHHISFLKT